MTFSSAIIAAKTIKSLVGLLDTGYLVSLLPDVEFSAAREALQRVGHSSDKHGQIRVCIGHLNSAYHGYIKAIDGMTLTDKTLWSRGVDFVHIKDKACFVLCVRALCHEYLAEHSHAIEDVRQAKMLNAQGVASVLGASYWTLSALVNPLAWIDIGCALGKAESSKKSAFKINDGAMKALSELLAH